MSDNNPSSSDVLDSINSLPGTDARTDEQAGGVSATVPEQQIGAFYRLARLNDWDVRASRIGDTLSVQIEAEQDTLGDLFA